MYRKIINISNELAKTQIIRWSLKWKTKYFCIGRNKTGTTSLEQAFKDLGYTVGDQLTAETLANTCYFDGFFEPIINYCKDAQVFQDAPFSFPDTYKILDVAYPGSKFILTIRDDAEQWYQSLIRFHAKLFANGVTPSADDLRKTDHKIKNYIFNSVVRLHGTPEDDPYNKEIMIKHYLDHNEQIVDYFKDRPDDLLVINISQNDSYQRFIDFLEVESPDSDFPWKNKT